MDDEAPPLSMTTIVFAHLNAAIIKDSRGEDAVGNINALLNILEPGMSGEIKGKCQALTKSYRASTLDRRIYQTEITLLITAYLGHIGYCVEVRENPESYFREMEAYMDAIIKEKRA